MIKSACHDNQAENYDKKLARHETAEFDYLRENYFKIHDRVIQLLDIKKTDRILDIGIGTGLLEEKINKKCALSGIDISKKMLARAAEKSLSVELKVGSFTNIPYPDNSFNSIISCFAFHHLTNLEKKRAVKECERVLKDHGKLIIADFMYLDIKERKALINRFREEERIDMIEEMNEENFTNINWFTGIFSKYKFEIGYEPSSTISWIVIVKKK